MEKFDELYSRWSEEGSSLELKSLLKKFYNETICSPINTTKLKTTIIDLLSYLVSPKGRTNANCQSIGWFIAAVLDYNKIKKYLPATIYEILSDIQGIHDTIKDPNIASTFESTPEQLLERIKKVNI